MSAAATILRLACCRTLRYSSNVRNGIKAAAVAVAGSGHFDAALVDFSGGLVVAVGDRLRIGVAGAAGSTSGDPFEYQITAEDVARRLANLVDRRQKPGYYSLQWSGTDDSGRLLPGGVYLLRFQAGDYRNHQKIVVVR